MANIPNLKTEGVHLCHWWVNDVLDIAAYNSYDTT
jgi:hypothetical protein